MGPRITILNSVTQDALTNTSTSQFGPFVYPTNHVVETMVTMILDARVNPSTNINIGEPQVSHQHIFTLEPTTQLVQHDSNLTTHQLAKSYDVKHIHNLKSNKKWLQW
jgi:hypothetical protein